MSVTIASIAARFKTARNASPFFARRICSLSTSSASAMASPQRRPLTMSLSHSQAHPAHQPHVHTAVIPRLPTHPRALNHSPLQPPTLAATHLLSPSPSTLRVRPPVLLTTPTLPARTVRTARQARQREPLQPCSISRPCPRWRHPFGGTPLVAGLNLRPFCTASVTGSSEYDLAAVVTHHGPSLSSGHYTAYVRDLSAVNPVWYHVDDSKVQVRTLPLAPSAAHQPTAPTRRCSPHPLARPRPRPTHPPMPRRPAGHA